MFADLTLVSVPLLLLRRGIPLGRRLAPRRGRRRWMWRRLGHLRAAHGPVLPQIIQLLRAQRTARIGVLNRLPLLIETWPRRRRHCAIVELLLWALVLHLHTRRGRTGPRKLFGPVNRIRRAFSALDRHRLLSSLLAGLAPKSDRARIIRRLGPRLIGCGSSRPVRIRWLRRLLIRLSHRRGTILICGLSRWRLRLRLRRSVALLSVRLILSRLIRLTLVRIVPVLDLIDLVRRLLRSRSVVAPPFDGRRCLCRRRRLGQQILTPDRLTLMRSKR